MGNLHAHYQPIVSLESGEVLGYEALARQDGSFPVARFAAARATGGLQALDEACVRAAFEGAHGLRSTLFVNVEPECFDGPVHVEAAPERVVVELTERGLTERPAELLAAVERVRALGWGVAVDDVGADWRSLALMPFLRPDVVKLDRSLLAGPASADDARVIRATRAHISRYGGLLLAEGIEETSHEQRARALGAVLVQGYHYGRPGLLPPAGADAGLDLVQTRSPIGDETPFEVLAASGAPRGVGSKAELLPLSVDLEREAAETRDPAVVLSTFQTAERFTPRTRDRYAALADGAAFVAAFGVGMPPEPVAGVRGAGLADGERLRDEWCVIVVGPHATLALIARDLGDNGPDAERRFEYALSEDKELVMRAARALMLRVVAAPAARPAIRADVATQIGTAAGASPAWAASR